MKFKRQTASQSSTPDQDTYWLELPDSVFLLKVEGKTRAGVLLDANSGEILRGVGSPPLSIVTPDSEVVFNAVEQKLGLGRVSKFQSPTGPCRADWRGIAEQRAERFRKAHPPGTEAEHYCAAALHFLDQKSQRGLLGRQASEARRHLQQTMILLKASNHEWTPEACETLAQASKSLGAQRMDAALQEPWASLACRKALAVLERERVLGPSPVNAPDGRGSAAGPSPPTHDARPKSGAFWLVVGDGAFSLEINGESRAHVAEPFNTAHIPGLPGGKIGEVSAPDSVVIFDVVEKLLGQDRITEFRTPAGHVTDIDWRGMAEQQARWFRQDCPPQAEAEFYCRAARTLLSEKSTLDGLSPEASEAHHHLRGAIVHLEANNGEWTVEAIDHLSQAQQLLRDAPVQVTTAHEPEAHFHCEKGAAVLARDGIIAQVASHVLSADYAASVQSPADACWVDLGRGSYGLLIDGEQHATAYAGLNIVSVLDRETLRLKTVAALDSETIFDAAESRLGIPPVTNILPQHREQVRDELAKLAAEFRDLHPQDAEPAVYIERALDGLDAARTHSDIASARLHLGKALAAFREGESLADVAQQVDHACQYLPSLSASPSDSDQSALNVAADCDRALSSIERNRSMQRPSAELTPAFSAARGRTI